MGFGLYLNCIHYAYVSLDMYLSLSFVWIFSVHANLYYVAILQCFTSWLSLTNRICWWKIVLNVVNLDPSKCHIARQCNELFSFLYILKLPVTNELENADSKLPLFQNVANYEKQYVCINIKWKKINFNLLIFTITLQTQCYKIQHL